MQRKMVKIFSILLLICTICVVFGVMRPTDADAATATKLVLKVNSEWTSDGARFAAYFFNNSTGASKWVSLTSKGNNIYVCSVPSGYPNVIFCRMNGGNSTNSWDNKWNQSSDLSIPADTSCMYTMKSGWWDGDNGTWGACSHSWNSGTVTKAATCSATGTKTYTCNYCSGTKTETIAKTAHNYAAATCTVAQKCKSCGATTGSALGHNYSYAKNVNPTESAAGSIKGTCSRCSGTTTVSLPKLTTSNYSRSQTKAPTCTATGTYTWTWNTKTYGTFSYTTSIAAKGHSWKAATCTAPKTCSSCGATSGSKLGHSYTYKATKNPTTSATGTLTGTCSRCSGTTTVSLPKLTTSNYTRTTSKAATCTATGTYSWKWNTTTYGTFTFTTSIPAKGHSYGNASCSAPATCTTCGATTGSALGHNYSYKVTKNPTTSASGTLVGTCTRCSASTGNITIGKLGTTYHTYKVTKAPTCTATGTGRYTWGITDYGTYYWDVSIPANGHSYSAATCTKPQTCSVCGATTGSALGHSYTSKVTKEATCTADGVRTYTCSKCSNSYTEAIGKLGHSYTSKVTAPTCTAQGYTTHTCSRCSDSYKDTYKDATGHSYSSKVTTAATCEKDGVKTFTCSNCSHSYTESIPATGHNYVGGKCGNCGSTKTVALPGDFNNWDTQAMTWTSSGYTYSVKLSAGTYKFKVLKDGTWLGNNGEIWDTTTATSSVGWEFADWGSDCALVATGGTYNFTFNFDTNMLVITYTHTHAYTAGTVVAPTCTAKGYTVYTCPCGSTENRDEKAATGHSYTSKVTKEATCTADGVKTFTCSKCSNSYTEAIGKLGHSYTSKVTAPTCTAQGYTTHTCSRCSDSYKDTYKDALGHSYTYSVTKNPTESAAGTLTGTCSRCSGTTTVTLPKLNTTDYSYSVTKQPTCTATGTGKYTWKTTTYGSYSFTVTLAAKGHSYGNASCTEAATCSVCGTSTGSALGHNYSYAVTKEPTTSASGTLTGTCSRCSSKPTVTLPKLNTTDYSYSVTKAATCTATGTGKYTWKTTTYGSYSFNVTIAATGHSYSSKVTAPTCTAQGYTTHTCGNCGDSYKDTYKDALGHSYSSKVTKEATCTADGVRTYTCSVCGGSYTEVIGKLGHSYSSKVTAPTCTAKGYTTYTCATCGDSYKADYVDALGHSYSEKVDAATCETDGLKTFTCGNCGHSYTEVIPATGHNYVGGKCGNCGDTKTVSLNGTFNDWAGQNMTWTEKGYTLNIVLPAGTYQFKLIKDGTWLGNNGDIVDTTTATSDIGWEFADWAEDCDLIATGGTYTFTFNFDTNMLVIEYVHTHAYTAGTVVAPTCTAKGYTVYTCPCGDTENRDEVAALGHDHVGKVTTAATCETDGVKTFTCSRCGDSYTQVIGKLGHDYKAVVTAPTCEAKGYTTHTCSRCGGSYVDSYVDALGHNFVNGSCTNCGTGCDHQYTSVVTKAPTCTADGVRTYTCSVCGGSYTEVIAKLGHDYKSVVTAPTCTAQGYATYTCATCGDSYKADYVDALGHSYSSKVTTAATCETDGLKTFTCGNCGHSYTEVIPATGHSYVGGKCSACGDTKVVSINGSFNDWAGQNMTWTENGYTLNIVLPAGTYQFKLVKDGTWLGNNGDIEDTTTATSSVGWEFVDLADNCDLIATGGTYTFTFNFDTNFLVIEFVHTHAYTAGEVVAPTCTEKGYTVYTCPCGDTENRDEVAALGHDYQATVTAPTCTEQGYTTHTCSRCGDSYTDTYTDTIAHSYVGDTCQNCGDVREYYLFGYINGTDYAYGDYGSFLGEYKFVDGKLTLVMTTDSYVAVKADDNWTWYMAESYCTDKTVVLKNTALGEHIREKLFVPGGTTVTFTLVIHADDTLTLSYVIDACQHKYESVVTDPTCEAGGYTTHTCSVCGDTYTDSYTEATGHSYVGDTCTACGAKRDYYLVGWINGKDYGLNDDAANLGEYKFVGGKLVAVFEGDCYVFIKTGDNLSWYQSEGYCDAKSVILYNDELGLADPNKLFVPGGVEVTFTLVVNNDETLVLSYEITKCDHNYVGQQTKAPTCETAGEMTYTCSVCDHSYTESIPALGHSYTSVVTKPTCTTVGYTTYTCANCGHSYVADEVAALGHSYTSQQTKAPTCTEDGEMTFTCGNCGDSYTESIPALGHSYTAVVTKPTCTTVGYTTYTCANCGHSYVADEVAALGHSYTSQQTKAPTCTEAGENTFTCGTCGDSYTESVPATGHNYVDNTCTICGNIKPADETITVYFQNNWLWTDVYAYVWVGETPVVAWPGTPADFYAFDGTYDIYCVTIPANANVVFHGIKNDGTGASDQTPDITGAADGDCYWMVWNDGNAVEKDNILNVYCEHNYTSEQTKAPTCTEKGELTYTCSKCGDSYTEEIDALGHKHEAVVTAPTCEAGGYTTYTCACGDSYTGNETEALGHNYVDGVCDRCGQREPVSQYITVYFQNNWLWTDVYAYVWTGDNAFITAWPGEKATFYANDGTYDIYCVTIPAGYKVIFSGTKNDGSGATDQTPDIKGAADGDCYWMVWNDGNAVEKDHIDNVYTPVCDHSYTAQQTKAPTCTEAGELTYTCSKCGDSYTESVPATGHNYVDGTCTGCGQAKPVTDYYLIGYINGADYGCNEDGENLGIYKFEGGQLVVKFEADSYVFIKTGDNQNWYMFEGYCSETTGTLYNTTSGLTDANKMFVPGGVEVIFTLTDNGDDTFTLSYVENICEHSYEGSVTTEATCTEPGVMTYTCSVCGDSYTEQIPAKGHSYVNGVCSVCGYAKDNNIKIHFVNTLGWQGVVGYIWKDTNGATSGINGITWPGVIVQRDNEGYYTLELEYTPASGQSLGVLFHDFYGNQTADVLISYQMLTSSHEIWVKPATSKMGDKYSCTVVAAENGTVISPEVNGQEVTFRYAGTATSVALAGTMNGWSQTADLLTKGDDGVWSITMTLEPGVYEYKFVVNGSSWILDPANGNVGGFDGNNTLVVPADDTTVDNGQIKVVLHFYRSSGDYSGWDVWFWGQEKSGAASFTADPSNKGMIATFTVDGSKNANLGYVIRKSDWSSQEFYDRFIDLSDVKSGTVHYYVNAGVASGSRVLGEDVVSVGKLSYANYDYQNSTVWVKATLPLANPIAGNFSICDGNGNATGITVTSATLENNGYRLTLSKDLTITQANTYKVRYADSYADIHLNTTDLFYSSKFASEYTYNGDDLGATWSRNSTTFKVWAPTALNVHVKIYDSGNYGSGSQVQYVQMTQGDKGVWTVTVPGNWHGYYYNYDVSFAGYTVEATDPYARSTGSNGDRGMILNLDATDPSGWANDISPNQGMSYTDAIIYELHVREFTYDGNSGVKAEWRGNYLGLTQTGTSYQGHATGLDYLKELGVTHVQLMPVTDFSSVDEYHDGYAWGYDPKNFMTPEGSYSTDPYNGNVRVNEFKEMVQTFHENGINVTMDVVFNHAFDGGNFCYNKIVPNYFSRFYADGSWSNGSGVGNDLATERSMTRNYIVDTILYWVEEYHIDGFRFDLAGLIDTQTINEIVSAVHAKHPYVMFYGEGWAAGGTAVEYGYTLATKDQAWQTPGFGYFNDDYRNGIAGDNGNSWGFATGSWDYENSLANWFKASNSFSKTPTQTINYVSCHDNYCLTDKLLVSRNGAYWEEIAKMNRLSNAIVLMSEGVPFLYSGDEMLRERKDYSGNRLENAHMGGDYSNTINWADLVYKQYADETSDYYKGLIEFRKNHAALRISDSSAQNYVTYHRISDQTVMFYISGYPNYECSDGIVVIFNASSSYTNVDLYNYGIPTGNWQAVIHGDKAGVTPLWGVDVTANSGTVGVEGISTTVLVLGDLVHEESVYNKQASKCSHYSHNISAMCTSCGKTVSHSFVNGVCACGLSQSAPATYTVYYDNSTTNWSNVNIYAWTTTAGQTKEYAGTWSGSPMTLIDEENGIYAYELPVGAANVIFSGDGSQSDNLTAPGYSSDATLFDDGQWVIYTGACDHSYTDEYIEEPTCILGGLLKHTCSLCGYEFTEEVEALGHDYVAEVTEATCVSGGYTTYTCSRCADSYVDDQVPALGHDYVDGICSVCGTEKAYFLFGYINGANYGSDGDEATMGIYQFVDGQLTVTFKENSYVGVKTTDNENWYMTNGYLGEDVTSATLYDTSVGIDANKLFVPGGLKITFSLAENEDGTLTLSYQAAACEHEYESVVTDPTCTEGGYTTHSCIFCGDSYTDTEVEALGHDFADGFCQRCGAIDPAVCEHEYDEGVVTDPTCTEGGYTTYTCQLCGHSYTADQTEATGHSHEAVITEPTCTEPGYTTYTCACGDSYVTDETEALGHNFVDGFCDRCGAVDPATCDHAYEGVVTEPTCTEGGFTTNTCSICGNVEITDLTEALGHTYEAVITAPTCTAKGYTTYTCACGDSYVADETEMVDHSYVDGSCQHCGAIDPAVCVHAYEGVVTEPTCTAGGYTTYTCTVCGHSYTADETETIDHDYVDGFCSVCGKEQPVGCEHKYESVVTEPTCTEGGYTTHTCALCGDSYTDTETEALGHDFVDGVCSICGGKDIDNCEHEYVKTAVDATCTEQGGDKYTCSKCGHSYLENATDALGHNFVDGICDRCGHLKPLSTTYYLVGWINGGNHGCEEDGANMGNYPITDNMFKYTFDQTSYVFLKTEGNGKWFMCDGYPGDGVCFANLYDTGLPIKHDKVNVPGGVEITFTLIERDDGSVTLTYVTAGNCSHNWYTQTLEWPGCTTTGVMLHRCIMCADSYTTTIPAKGHSYNGGSNCWDCGAQNPNYTYYYQIVGWINGQNVGCEENWEQPGFQFSGNRLTMTFTENSYIYLKTHDNSKWFMTDGYPGDDATSATFYHTDSYWEIQKDKLFVPKGRTITFTISVRSDNTIYLSYVAASCQHNYDSWVNFEATCTSDGERAYKCTKCDDYYTEVIKATGHNFSGTSCTKCGAVAPGQAQIYYLVGYINGANYGCEEDYLNMGIYKFVDGQLVATFSADSYVYIKTQGNTKWFLTQSYVETNIGTFYEGGTEKMLVKAGIEYRFTLVENADGSLTLTYGPSNCDHTNVTEEITAPSCTEKGFTTLICNDCGHREITNETQPTGHSYVDGACEHCGAIDPAFCTHSYDEGVVTAPTCTAKGYTTYICTICGTTHIGDYTDMLPHDFVDGVCTVCGAEDKDPSEIYYLIGYINGADYGCNADYERLGIYEFVDGKLMVKFAADSYVYIKTGDNLNWFMTAAYVSDTTGTFANTSTGAMEKMLIPGGVEVILTLVVNEDGTLTLSYQLAQCEGHSYTDTVVAPSCTANGYTEHTCQICGFTYRDAETDALGHNFVSGTCDRCGETQGQIPDDGMITVYFQNNWLWTDVYVYFWNDEGANAEWPGAPATWFANDGTYDIYCVTMPAGSNVIFSGSKNDGSGSDRTPDIVGAEDGDIYWMVWNDGNAVEKDNIDNILGECEHEYEATVTEPGCKTPGYTTHSCKFCTDSYVDTHTAPVGHSFVDGICTVCGEAQIPELQDFYLIGYINGANYGCDEDWENLGIYKFVDGKLVAHFKQDSYVFVKTGDNGSWFMTEGFGGTEIPYAQLFNTNVGLTDANKLFVPGGMKISFVLVRTGDDTFILGYTVSACEHPSHSITGKCDYCGEIQEHTFETTVNDYTCTEDGGVTHTCTVCGHSYTTDTVPATGHAFVDGFCKYCGIADESGCVHEYEMTVDEGKCNLGAFTVNTCKLCGNVYHVYFNADMDWTMDKPVDIHDSLLATKPMFSYRDYETVVSDVDTMEGWELIGSELIDEELGIYQYTFGRWTEWSEWSEEEVLATETREVRTSTAFRNVDAVICDHIYEAFVTAPTCTEMGYTTYICSVCGETYVTEYTDALGHSYEDVVTAPTCTTGGYTTHTCATCGDSYVDSYTDPTGHTWTDGVCECGKYALQHVGATLTLESEVKYNLYFYLNDDSIDISKVGLLTFLTLPENATIDNASFVLSDMFYDTRLGYNAMQTQGIPAKMMGDSLYLRLYAQLEDGTIVYGKVIEYSAKTYATNVLAKPGNTDLKNTLIAMLNYGAAAQELFGYKTDSLMNADLTAEQQATQPGYSADLLNGLVVADPSKAGSLIATEGAITQKSAGVTLTGALQLQFFFLPGKTVDNGEMMLYYWTTSTYNSVDELTLENADGSMAMAMNGSFYQGTVSGIAAKDLDKTVYVLAVFESDGETCMSGITSYSIEQYCRNQVASGTKNQAMCEALTIYSYFTKVYFKVDQA